MKLKKIHREIPVKVSRERMWEILKQYGDVSRFHAGVVRSYKADGSKNTAAPGCERVCEIVDFGLHITLKERIVDFIEGESYTYEVYEWENFPIREMRFGFTILDSAADLTWLGIDIEYLAKPVLLTPFLAEKLNRLARDVLLGYKNYAETGEKRVPIKTLKSRFKSVPRTEVQYG
ncbi:MAG: SRPBCC family protein [Pseudomonadota bacterium]|nr:SRPBCC family protein [Pseudomonadota bacterium]